MKGLGPTAWDGWRWVDPEDRGPLREDRRGTSRLGGGAMASAGTAPQRGAVPVPDDAFHCPRGTRLVHSSRQGLWEGGQGGGVRPAFTENKE